MTFHVPEQCRMTPARAQRLGGDAATFASTRKDGQNGVFWIPGGKNGKLYLVQASDGMGWEHVSVSMRTKNGAHVQRPPRWEDMCQIKAMFWDEDDCVVQYHPAKEDYVNLHPFTLHLWRPTQLEMPRPEPEMVG